jgi:hypothetical protein
MWGFGRSQHLFIKIKNFLKQMPTSQKITKKQIRAIQALFASPLQSGKVRLAAFRFLKSVEESKQEKAPKTQKKRNNRGLIKVPCSDKYL